MEIPSSLNLIWEKNFGGAVGIYRKPKKVVFTPTLMKKIALSKMTSVQLISADFQENPVVFSPLLWLLLDHRASSLEFLGVYATEFPNKEDANNIPNGEDNVPSFCIRKSLWNRSEDIANCQLADNKEEYIIGKKQTFSQVIFINSRQVPKLTELILEVVEITKNGLKLQENIYKQSPYNEIKIYISEGSFDLNFAYKPYLMTNSLLEEWIIKWRNCIDGLPINIGYSPDEQFRMSYELSLFDQIQLFSEIQR